MRGFSGCVFVLAFCFGLAACGGGGMAAGDVSAPSAAVTPSAVSFSQVAVGTTSAARVVTLTNSGGAPLVGTLALAGTGASEFAQTNTCGTSLAAGASCKISVTFTPQAVGDHAARLTIGYGGDISTIQLTGTGTAAAPPASAAGPAVAVVSRSAVDLGWVNVGSTSPAQKVMLSNTGGTGLAIRSLAITGPNAGDFARAGNCGTGLAAGTSCTITLTFTPSAAGPRAASLVIDDNASGSTTQTVALQGTGKAVVATTDPAPSSPTSTAVALATVSPGTIDLGWINVGTTSPKQTVTLANTGQATLAISSIVVSGTNASEFSAGNGCGSSLAAGASCAVGLTFTPAAAGARSASLEIHDNSSGSSLQTVALVGTGKSVSSTSTTTGSSSAPVGTLGGVVPSFGPVAGGTVVSIRGSGFKSGASVSFGSAAATDVTVSGGGTWLEATTPQAAAAGVVTVQVKNPDGSGATLASAFNYSAQQAGCGGDCGHIGDPYGGGSRPASQQPISACNTNLQAGGNYVLTQNIGTDPAAVCLQVQFPTQGVSLDLNGHTVTGQVQIWDNKQLSYEVFNGAIACNVNDGECLGWHAGFGHIHHLTVSNANLTPLANIEIVGTAEATRTAPILKIDHVTSTVVASAPSQHRTRNIVVNGANGGNPAVVSVPVELSNNLITCSNGASACQGVELDDAPNSWVHNNRFVLPTSCPQCEDPARAILFDQGSNYGVATYNEIAENATNRGVRVRAAKHITVAGNLFENVIGDNRYAAVHVGETGGGIDDDFVDVFNNTFQLGAGGNAVVSTAAADVYVFDNTIACLNGDCSQAGYLANADIDDTLASDQTGGNIFAFNNDVLGLSALGRSAVHACGPSLTGYDCSFSLIGNTTATVCNSGDATGHGTIYRLSSPCPVPPADVQPKPATVAPSAPTQ